MSTSHEDLPGDGEPQTGLRGWLGRHRGAALAGGAVVVALGVFVLVWFQPQKLFIDERVDEALPTAAPAPVGDSDPTSGDMEDSDMDGAEAEDMVGDMSGDDMSGDTAEEPAGPQILAAGEFSGSGRYSTSGQALAIQLEDGSRILRLEGFETSNGPDLLVYLTSAEPGADEEYEQDFIDLGLLKGNIGDQNYDLDERVDLDRYRTVVIWCRRFTVSFGAAQLSAGA